MAITFTLVAAQFERKSLQKTVWRKNNNNKKMCYKEKPLLPKRQGSGIYFRLNLLICLQDAKR